MQLEIGTWQDLQAQAGPIRYAVFVEEQGVPADEEWDAFDPPSLHAVLRDDDGTPIATGRLLPDGHIGRMAVVADARGTGAGSAVLAALIECARDEGHRQVRLNAQTHACGFYEKMGFVAHGEVFLDAGIPHVEMSLDLTDDCAPAQD